MKPTARVLLVDDDRDVLRFVSEALADEGCTVLAARNGMDALALAKSQPNLILLDMQMPIMDGWEFVRLYRETPGPHAPIIIITAGRSAAIYAADIGAAGALPKPFTLESLIALVGRYAPQEASAA